MSVKLPTRAAAQKLRAELEDARQRRTGLAWVERLLDVHPSALFVAQPNPNAGPVCAHTYVLAHFLVPSSAGSGYAFCRERHPR